MPFWGRELIPETMDEVIRHGFRDLGLTTIWYGYFDDNEKSRRAQEKCGFRHHHTTAPTYFPLTGDVRVEHVSVLMRPTV